VFPSVLYGYLRYTPDKWLDTALHNTLQYSHSSSATQPLPLSLRLHPSSIGLSSHSNTRANCCGPPWDPELAEASNRVDKTAGRPDDTDPGPHGVPVIGPTACQRIQLITPAAAAILEHGGLCRWSHWSRLAMGSMEGAGWSRKGRNYLQQKRCDIQY
jgi:hypothetical protein